MISATATASQANSLTHGLSRRTFIVAPAARAEFDALASGLEQQLKPAGALETEMFGEIVHSMWTQRRIDQAEAALATTEADPLLDPAALKVIAVYSLLRSRAHRAEDRAKKQLRELQEERFFREARGAAAVPAGEAVLPRFASMRRKVAADERTSHRQEWDAALAAIVQPGSAATAAATTAPTRRPQP